MNDLVAHVGIALVGGLLAVPLSRSVSGVWIALTILIASTTVSRERFGIPFEVDALAAPMLATVLFLRERSRIFSRRSYPFAIVTIVYLAANLVATVLTPPVALPALRQCLILCTRAGTFYLVIIAVQALASRRLDIPRVFFALVGIQTLSSFGAYALYPLVDTPLVWFELHGPGSISLGGFFQEPNLLAAFLATSLVLVLPMVVAIDDLVLPRRFIALVGLALPALVLTYTRSAWVGSAIGVICLPAFHYVFERERFKRSLGIAAVVGALMAASMVFGMVLTLNGPSGSAVGRRFEEFVDPASPSAAGRLRVWGQALGEWRENPIFGSGPLSSEAGASYGWLYGSTIQTLHDSGIVGLASMLALVGLVAHLAWKGYRTAALAADRAVLLGFLIAQGVLFFMSQLSSFFWAAYTWVFLGLAAGYALVATDAVAPVTTRGQCASKAPSRRRDRPDLSADRSSCSPGSRRPMASASPRDRRPDA